MKKKGELTTQQLVTIIILIISFAVILFFILRLNFREETDKQICHNSVLLKSRASLAGNLNCKTGYLCISGRGKCSELNPSTTVKINLNQNKEKAKGEIIKALADEMADCWWMFGEGKIDYSGGFNFNGNSVCALCSVIDFDTGLQEFLRENQITRRDLFEFLSSNEKEKGVSYLRYISNSGDYDRNHNSLNNPIDVTKQHIVVTGITHINLFPRITLFAYETIFPFSGDEDSRKRTVGPFPPDILEKDSLKELNCDEFVTKA